MHYISQTEVIRVIHECDRLEDKLALAMAYLHALRVGELCRLRVCNTRDGFLEVQALKGGLHAHQRLISHPIFELNETAMLAQLIARGYPQIHGRKGLGANDALFPNRYPNNKNKRHDHAPPVYFNRLLKRIQAPAGIPEHNAHPHALRHSAAMHMLDSGCGLTDIQQYLRHKNLSSTGVYLKSNDTKASAAALAAFTKPAVIAGPFDTTLRGIK